MHGVSRRVLPQFCNLRSLEFSALALFQGSVIRVPSPRVHFENSGGHTFTAYCADIEPSRVVISSRSRKKAGTDRFRGLSLKFWEPRLVRFAPYRAENQLRTSQLQPQSLPAQILYLQPEPAIIPALHHRRRLLSFE